MSNRVLWGTLAVFVAGLLLYLLHPSQPAPPDRSDDAETTRTVIASSRPEPPTPRLTVRPAPRPTNASARATVIPPASVSGTVRIHGSDAPAAEITVKSVSRSFDSVLTTTDRNGSYTLAGVSPEPYFYVTADGAERDLFMLTTEMPRIGLEPGEAKTGVNFRLYSGRPGSISGQVTGRRLSFKRPEGQERDTTREEFVQKDDVPLVGVTIFLEAMSFERWNVIANYPAGQTVTDAAGRYRFEALHAGGYAVRAIRPQGAAFPEAWGNQAGMGGDPNPRHQVPVTSGPVTNVDFQFRLDSISIAGRVTDAAGRPIAGARITGEYCLMGSDEGEPVVRRSSPAIVTLSGEDGRYCVADLPSSSFGVPAAYLLRGNLSYWYAVRVEADGYVQAEIRVPPCTEHLLAGAFQLIEEMTRAELKHGEISSKEFEKWKLRVPTLPLPESKGNAITGVDFVFEKEAVVMGHVVDTEGNIVPGPRPSAWIRLVSQEKSDGEASIKPLAMRTVPPPDTVALDEAGRFTFKAVPAGTYSFEVTLRTDAEHSRRAQNAALALKTGEHVRDLVVIVQR